MPSDIERARAIVDAVPREPGWERLHPRAVRLALDITPALLDVLAVVVDADPACSREGCDCVVSRLRDARDRALLALREALR